MIITMKPNASPEETQRLISSIEGKGLEMHLIERFRRGGRYDDIR